MKWFGVAIMIAAMLISANAFAASPNPTPPGLQKAADCMYDVLKKEPGFEEATIGHFESDDFVLPYVGYLSPPDKLGRRIKVGFAAQLPCKTVHLGYNCCADEDHPCFWAELNGLIDPRYAFARPPDGDIGVVIKDWNARCGVDADATFN